MPSPFDFVNDISNDKKNLIVDEQSEKDYNPFMINRSLSYFTDTILYANEMNINYNIPKKQQNLYLLNSIRQRKRFSKWHKKAKDENIDLIIKYYNCSLTKATEIATLINTKQLQLIKEKLSEGG